MLREDQHLQVRVLGDEVLQVLGNRGALRGWGKENPGERQRGVIGGGGVESWIRKSDGALRRLLSLRHPRALASALLWWNCMRVFCASLPFTPAARLRCAEQRESRQTGDVWRIARKRALMAKESKCRSEERRAECGAARTSISALTAWISLVSGTLIKIRLRICAGETVGDNRRETRETTAPENLGRKCSRRFLFPSSAAARARALAGSCVSTSFFRRRTISAPCSTPCSSSGCLHPFGKAPYLFGSGQKLRAVGEEMREESCQRAD